MTITEIINEYNHNHRLSQRAVSGLRDQMDSDPYTAITIAADTGCFDLAPDIAARLNSTDPMVRWAAAATLFTRFRDHKYLSDCVNLVRNDPSSIVRSVAIVGLGELLALLPPVTDLSQRNLAVNLLLSILANQSEYSEIRSSAYEGILAAIGIHPRDRPSPGRLVRFPEDIAPHHLSAFLDRFGNNDDRS